MLMVMLPPVTSRLDSLPAAASCCRCASSRAMSGMLLDSTCVAPQHSTAQHIMLSPSPPAGRNRHTARTHPQTHKLAVSQWRCQQHSSRTCLMFGTTSPLLVAMAIPMLWLWCCSSAPPPGSRQVLSPGYLPRLMLRALITKGRYVSLVPGGQRGGGCTRGQCECVVVAIEFSTLAAIEFRSCRQGSSQESMVTP